MYDTTFTKIIPELLERVEVLERSIQSLHEGPMPGQWWYRKDAEYPNYKKKVSGKIRCLTSGNTYLVVVKYSDGTIVEEEWEHNDFLNKWWKPNTVGLPPIFPKTDKQKALEEIESLREEIGDDRVDSLLEKLK